MSHWIETFAIVLIGSGFALLLGLWYLRREAQTVRDEALALSHANSWNDFDALRLPAAAWPILQARFVSMSVEYEWFGMRRSEQFGKVLDSTLKRYTLFQRSLVVGDTTIDVFIWQKRIRGEQNYFASTLWEIFTLLLQMDLWIKSATVSSALEQSSKALTFVRHDAKNYIQLVSLIMNDIARLQAGPEGEQPDMIAPIIKRMHDVMPMMEARSKGLLAGLGTGEVKPASRQQNVEIVPLLDDLAEAYQLKPVIHGEGQVFVDPRVLESILENLLKNFADHGDATKLLHIHIDMGATLTIKFIQATHTPPDPATLLHMFEPFWTTSAAGLGLGLYQARLQAQEQGGGLSISIPNAHALCFLLTLPCAVVSAPVLTPALTLTDEE